MQLSTLEEKREWGNLTTIFILMNNLEETDRKYIILRGKREAENLWGQGKIVKMNLLKWDKKVQFFPKQVWILRMDWKKRW